MAFNHIGSFYLAPGASVRVIITYPAPGDMGAQWIMAHAAKGQPACELILTDPSKRLDYSIGWVDSAGRGGVDGNSYYYDYRVTVRNAGAQGVRFSLQGGGNV